MKRVLALLFFVSTIAAPTLAADLPRPLSLHDRKPKEASVHPSLRESKAEKTRRGRAWGSLSVTAPFRLSHGVRGN